MKKNSIIVILTAALLAGLLAGCGMADVPAYTIDSETIGSQPSGSQPSGSTEPIESSQAIVTTPPVYSTPVPEDSNQVRLLHFAGALTEDEEAAAKEELTTLYQNMEIPEYLGEAIHMVATEEWFDTMTPGTYVGSRSYTLQQGNLALLTVQIGEDSTGTLYADIRFESAEGRFLLLKQFGTVTQLLETTIKDNVLEGAFTNWTFDSSNGGIIREQGTYSGGVIVGECTRAERTGQPGDAFDLWTHREDFNYTVTTLYYDEQGNLTSVATPEPTVTPVPAATPKPTPKPTAKPAVNKPKPTAVPTPAPEPDEDEDEDEDDGGDNDQQPAPEPEPEPDPQPNPPQGGDVDMEWTPDLD